MVEAVNIERRVNSAVVGTLERLLDDARAGEIQGFAFAGVNARGDVFTACKGERLIFSQIGALDALKVMILLQNGEGIRDEIKRIINGT